MRMLNLVGENKRWQRLFWMVQLMRRLYGRFFYYRDCSTEEEAGAVCRLRCADQSNLCPGGQQCHGAAAVRALRYLYEQAPDAVKSIQVDGGSEFKGQFEEPCQADNIPLFVIPPGSPRHNSKVENANGMIRKRILNFYNDYETTIAGTQKVVDKGLDLYNTHRPNLALPMIEDRGVKRLSTPMAYTLALLNSSQAPPLD